MFQTGDLIMYGSSGVCRVDQVAPMENGQNANKNRLYYHLSMVYGSGTIFVPADTSIPMRPILSQDEVNALIDRFPHIEENQCRDRNLRVLSDHYRAAFDSHRCEDLVQLMKTVRAKGKDTADQGKKLGMVDQRYQKQAEDLVYSEFAAALDIPPEDVPHYIKTRMAQLEQ